MCSNNFQTGYIFRFQHKILIASINLLNNTAGYCVEDLTPQSSTFTCQVPSRQGSRSQFFQNRSKALYQRAIQTVGIRRILQQASLQLKQFHNSLFRGSGAPSRASPLRHAAAIQQCTLYTDLHMRFAELIFRTAHLWLLRNFFPFNKISNKGLEKKTSKFSKRLKFICAKIDM